MADHSVGAQDELHGSEASEASVFCFDNVSPENACFVDFVDSKTRRHSEIKQTRLSMKQDFSGEDCQNKTLRPH